MLGLFSKKISTPRYTPHTRSSMSDYSRAKIYKITCTEKPELVYYGSTCKTLKARLQSHQGHYQNYLMGKHCNVTSFQIVKYSTHKISLVEDYPCASKRELDDRENWWIENHPCVNKNKPGSVARAGGMKAYQAAYQKEHKERLLARASEPVLCKCGTTYSRSNKFNHFNTAKHTKRLAQYKKDIREEITAIMTISIEVFV